MERLGNPSQEGPTVWLIAGPTASGKSALALKLAEEMGGEIVNADSMQLYADLSVLTARPTEAETARVPHHLYGVADAGEAWSVGRWLRAAQGVLAEIAARGRPAVVVGGTGLYFRALTEGLADIPAISAEARAEVGALFDRMGERDFREMLRGKDPVAAARIAPGDRQRLSRAYEVLQATGRALTDWQAASSEGGAFAFRPLVVEPPRDVLYARCDARFEAMVGDGALEEVSRLVARDLDPVLPAMKALGVRELARHLAGEITLAEATELAQRETRRYAKRQLTWFRNQTPDWPRAPQ